MGKIIGGVQNTWGLVLIELPERGPFNSGEAWKPLASGPYTISGDAAAAPWLFPVLASPLVVVSWPISVASAWD